jgi:hypothetical protein
MTLVSIVINNYNYGQFLGNAIDSALSQTYPYVETIVVDDGSTDDSHSVIKSYGDRILPVYQSNGGQASAFNAGFAASHGSIICFLDADDVFLPHKVATIVNHIADPDAMYWCFHRLQTVDAQRQPLTPPLRFNTFHKLDLRQSMTKGRLRGKFPFAIPATSGLCFTRSLLSRILPMPTADAILLNDSFLQFAALALAAGTALDVHLALQRVHTRNAYTEQPQKQYLRAPINVLTAAALRDRFPTLKYFTNCLFAEGLGLCWKRGSMDASLKSWIDRYRAMVSPGEYPSIWMRATYHYLKP